MAIVLVLAPGGSPAAPPPDDLLAPADHRGAIRSTLPFASRAACESAVFNAVWITGNRRTRDEVIERELTCRPGDPADCLDRSEIEDRLRNTHLFSEVSIRTDSPVDPCLVDLQIEVRERPSILPIPIVTNSGKSGLSGGFGLAYRNFRGLNERLDLAGQVGGVQGLLFRYSNPWITGNRVSVSVSTSFRRIRNRFDDFDEDRIAAGIRVGSYLSANEHWRGAVGADFQLLESNEPDKTISPDNRDRIHSLNMSLSYETRDLYRNPSRGHSHTAGIAWHGGALGGTVSYAQYGIALRRYQPVPWGRTLALAASWVRRDGRVPTYDRLRLGGSSTIRGYEDGALEGDHAIMGGVEWRFDILPARSKDLWFVRNIDIGLSAAVFADAGATWGNGYEGIDDPLTWSDVATSFGGGFRLLIPWIEVARIDYAVTESGRGSVVFGQGMRF